MDETIKSKDFEALKKLEERYQLPGTGPELRHQIKNAISDILNDPDWLINSGSVKQCQAFLATNPHHARRAEIEKKTIDLEVTEILAGKYGQFPKMTTGETEKAIRGSSSKVTIGNQTGHTLTLRYSGTVSLKIIIPEDETETFEISNGHYTVVASVDAGYVDHYVGAETFKGYSHSSSFKISISGMPSIGDIFPGTSIPGR